MDQSLIATSFGSIDGAIHLVDLGLENLLSHVSLELHRARQDVVLDRERFVMQQKLLWFLEGAQLLGRGDGHPLIFDEFLQLSVAAEFSKRAGEVYRRKEQI